MTTVVQHSPGVSNMEKIPFVTCVESLSACWILCTVVTCILLHLGSVFFFLYLASLWIMLIRSCTVVPVHYALLMLSMLCCHSLDDLPLCYFATIILLYHCCAALPLSLYWASIMLLCLCNASLPQSWSIATFMLLWFCLTTLPQLVMFYATLMEFCFCHAVLIMLLFPCHVALMESLCIGHCLQTFFNRVSLSYHFVSLLSFSSLP